MSFAPHHAAGPKPRSPAAAGPAALLQQPAERGGLVALTGKQDKGNGLAVTVGAPVDFGVPSPRASGLRRGRPRFFGAGGMGMSPDKRGVHEVDFPRKATGLISPQLQLTQDPLPDAGLAPAPKLTTDRLSLTVSLRQVTPASAGAENRDDAVQHLAVVQSRSASTRFLRP